MTPEEKQLLGNILEALNNVSHGCIIRLEENGINDPVVISQHIANRDAVKQMIDDLKALDL